jgi:hypothetical protein
MTKRPTYRCPTRKYKKLQHKLIDFDMTYQDFADWCVDQAIADKINPKGEKEMKKTITNFTDFQEFANSCGLDNNYAQLKWEKWFLDQEESFNYFEENDSFDVYFDGEGIYAEWEEGFVEETLREKI